MLLYRQEQTGTSQSFHPFYRDFAENIILDTYGRMIADNIRNGFDDSAKQKIRDSIKKEEKKAPEIQQTERMLLWQKYL